MLLERQGVAVPYRTLHRFCAERCGYGRSAATTVRVADGEPGMECQLDFGYLGLIADPVSGRQRKVHALIFTACYSRHMFVWLSFTQTLAAGCRHGAARSSNASKFDGPDDGTGARVPGFRSPHGEELNQAWRLHVCRRVRAADACESEEGVHGGFEGTGVALDLG